MITLRIFHIRCVSEDDSPPLEEYLPVIMGVSNQAPHLEYIAVTYGKLHCWKRVGEEWVVCGMAELAPLLFDWAMNGVMSEFW